MGFRVEHLRVVNIIKRAIEEIFMKLKILLLVMMLLVVFGVVIVDELLMM